ncbi:hypothetical protein I4U23_022303 [Adineta vaga]|nr:hypothetical protein I4U23_022303 [Adineta vaga]
MSTSLSYPSLVLIQKLLTYYVYPLIITFGCLGNLLNIFLLSKKVLRTTSCNNYFLASSCTNLVILSVGISTTMYIYDRPWAISTIYCRTRSYLINVSQQISRYMIIMACFDRFALCSTNIYLRQFSRINIARYYVIPIIIIIWFIFPIYMLIFGTAINNTCTYLGIALLYNSIYGMTMVGFIPPFLMFIFSLLTFYNLKIKQQRRQQGHLLAFVSNEARINENRKQQKKDQQVLSMLMIQVIVYISTTTLASSYLLYSTLTTYLGVIKSNQRISIETFISFIVNTLNFTCPCLSFYLFYFVSRLYRKQMKLAFLTIRRQYCCYQFVTNNHNIQHLAIRQMIAKVEPIE